MRRFFLSSFLVSCLLSLVSSLSFSAPSNPDKIIAQAQAKEEAGDYEGAQALYESVLKYHPENEPALMGLAQVHYWQGHYQPSIDTYAKILEREPGHVKALVGTGKAYLAMGKQKKAQEFFNRAEKIEPDNEEAESLKPQISKKTKLQIFGGYVTQTFNYYATESQAEFQEIRVAKEKSYSFGLNTTYLSKFANNAFDTKLNGSYTLFENTRIDAGLTFAPNVIVAPKQSYMLGLAHTFWMFTPEVHYRFENYSQAKLHTVRTGLYFESLDWIKVGGGYEFQNQKAGGVAKNFHSSFGDFTLTPLDWISFNGYYTRIHRAFEAGRPLVPFKDYKANVGGGGFSLELMAGYVLNFDLRYESRNNGENNQTYTFSFGYSI